MGMMNTEGKELDSFTPVPPSGMLAKWWASLKASKTAIVALLMVGGFAVKTLTPDTFLWPNKRQKVYRFRGNALGFFVGDLSVFATSSAEEAETRLVDVFPEDLRPKVQKVIRPVLTLSEKHQVDPFWVLSVMWTESHFKYQATSKKGAAGLMQVMPSTHAGLIEKMKKAGIALESDRGEEYLSATYPDLMANHGYSVLVRKLRNLEVGIYYLKTLLNDFDHNHFHATVAYNMGPSWTKVRLKQDLPVAKRNHYLSKVMDAYFHITKNLSHNANVSYIPRAH
jgi:hypothetical protein